MITALGIIVFVVLLLVSVAWHELGHLIPAKAFGVKVSQYMVGFGPTLWSRRKGETEYGIKWFPLGGYIRMAGMYSPNASAKAAKQGWRHNLANEAREASAEELQDLGDKRAFYTLSAPKKLVVMLGGPTMNLILALVLIAFTGSVIGSPGYSTTFQTVANCYTADGVWTDPCTSDTLPAPAAEAGIQPGDKVVAFNGQKVQDWFEFANLVANQRAKPAQVTVQRDGQEITLEVTPLVFGSGKTARAVIGVSPSQEMIKDSITAAPGVLWNQVTASAGMLVRLPVSVWNTGAELVQGKERSPDSPVSMLGVARISGDAAERAGDVVPQDQVWPLRWAMWLQLAASVNIALWLFNLLPLLPLDGGHVINALFEGARRQIARLRKTKPLPGPADSARLMPLTYAVVAVFGLMMLVMFTADIVNPVRL